MSHGGQKKCPSSATDFRYWEDINVVVVYILIKLRIQISNVHKLNMPILN